MSTTPADDTSITPVSQTTIHRAPAISLPADPAASAALVLRYVQTANTTFDRSAAIEAMTARLARFRYGSSEEVLDELAGHAALLDALFQRFTAEAVAARAADHKSKFLKLALASQASYVRTLVAIVGLNRECKSQAHAAAGNRELPRNSGDSCFDPVPCAS